MRKQEFIYQLWKKLSDLPKDEVEERLSFYSEIIDDRMEEGLSEEEAVAAIGSTDELAAQVIEDIPLTKIAKEKIKPKRRLSGWEIALVVLGFPIWFPLLAVLPLTLTVSLYVSIWTVVISLWAVFGALAGSALGVLVGGIGFAFTGYVPTGIALIGASLVCAGLCVFIFFGCKAATKGTVRLTQAIIRRIKNLFIRKEPAQ